MSDKYMETAIKLFDLEKTEGLQELTNLSPSLIDVGIFNQTSKKVEQIFEDIKKDTTDPAYVGMKGKFPYVDSKYMENKFDKYFPMSKVRYGNPSHIIVKDYWVIVFVEIDAYLTKDVFITRTGTGGSIMQVTTGAKEAALGGERPINPFDYVSVANAFKSALTNAIGNAHSRFGIASDFYKRIILSKEELETIKTEIQYIRSKVDSPRDKTDIKERYANCKSAGDKVKLLHQLREEHGITNAVEVEEQSESE